MCTDRQTDRRTDRMTTVTLAAHARRGLMSITCSFRQLIGSGAVLLYTLDAVHVLVIAPLGGMLLVYRPET